MKLNLRGHEDRYAIEQSLLAFFPEERPVYEGEDGDSHAEVTLHEGNVYATGVTTLTYGGKTARGEARVRTAGVSDAYERERLRQRALKLSFFRAARDVTGVTPSWGALTGIRPAKLVRTMLEDGMTPAQADRVLRDTYCVSPARRRLALESAEAGLKARSDLRPEDISLYIGIPFCPTRCAYCSFVSASVEKSFKLMEPYLAALTAEVEAAGRMVKETGLRIKSFYMGGGTPTTLSASQMDALLTAVNRNFDLSDCVEYCIEAGRPDTIDREKLQVLLDHGADRISVNPQSLEPRVLSAIGRKHSPEDIEKAMKGMLTPEFRENVIGHAEVRNVFKITGVGIVAGSYVTDGKLQRNAQVRLLRDNVVVYEGKLSSLQRFKDAVKEVADGYECGVCLENYTDIKEGDVIECFVMEEIPR